MREVQNYSLTSTDDLVAVSKILRDFITSSDLAVNVDGKHYVNVDGWKFAGLTFGLLPIVAEPVPLHLAGETLTVLYHEVEKRGKNGKYMTLEPMLVTKSMELADKLCEAKGDAVKRRITTDFFSYKCGCDVIAANDRKIGAGWGACSNFEVKKVAYDEFAVLSMSQTRAIGRALKNVLGFIMKAAGYEPTPSEEMDGLARYVKIDEDSSIDVMTALEKCANIDELVLLWDGLPGTVQSHTVVKTAFKRRKIALNKR
jgi:hypothetical protein